MRMTPHIRASAWRVLVFACLPLTLWCPAASATVTLTARVVRGGLDLDFGMVAAGEASRTEEIELTFTSTGGAQYRVYQEVPGWLVSERGERFPAHALLLQVSRGPTGMRGSGGIVPLTDTAQELFVSDAQGTSDTLLIAYSVAPSTSLVAGSYRGVLRFTVESLDTRAIVTRTMNVQLAVGATLRLERASLSPSQVSLGEVASGERSSVSELLMQAVSNTSSPVQLTQELTQPLTSGPGDTLPAAAFTYQVVLPRSDQTWRAVTTNPEVILADDRGELRHVHLAYAVEVPVGQPAGTYRGTLRFRLSSLTAASAETLTVPVELVVKEVFTMTVKPADAGAAMLHFDRVIPGKGPVERTMIVEVRTNMGRPYQVLAGLDHALVLPTGETLPANALMWSILKTEHGSGLIASDTPVVVGYKPLYQSDAKGSPDSFALTYRLSIPADAKDGHYSSQLQFTTTLF